MELYLKLKEGLNKKGPYYYCYCGISCLGAQNLMRHLLESGPCRAQFSDNLSNESYYPPKPKKWWQKLRRQKDPFTNPPKLTLPGLK